MASKDEFYQELWRQRRRSRQNRRLVNLFMLVVGLLLSHLTGGEIIGFFFIVTTIIPWHSVIKKAKKMRWVIS